MPLPNKDTDLLIKCDCSSHLLEINNDVSWLEDKADPFFYFTIWDQNPYSEGLWYRFKLAIRIIFGKDLLGGTIVFRRDDIENITTFLSKQLQENAKKLEATKQT